MSQTQSLWARWKKVSLPNKLTVLCTFIIALATLWYAIAAHSQWKVMIEQLKQIKSGSGQTERLIEETHTLAVNAGQQATNAAAQVTKLEALVVATQKQAAAGAENAKAAISTAKTADLNLKVSERPWVSADTVAIVKPLTFEAQKGASMTIGYILRNTGRSPALHAMWRSKLIALSMTNRTEISDRQAIECDPMLTMQSRLLDTTVFPGDKIPQGEGIGLSPTELENALKARDHGPFAHPGYVSLVLIACIDYQIPFASEHRQTRYAFWVGIPQDQGGFMGDIKPEGTRSDLRLIYYSQSAN